MACWGPQDQASGRAGYHCRADISWGLIRHLNFQMLAKIPGDITTSSNFYWIPLGGSVVARKRLYNKLNSLKAGVGFDLFNVGVG
jgi:hypothetical protein